MPADFRVSAQVDEDKKLVTFKMSGVIDSATLIDVWISFYASLHQPWSYDRLFDYRRSEGVVDYDEVLRLAQWWRDHTPGSYHARVAVIVNNPFDQARVSVISELFPNETRQAFTGLGEALEWLGRKDDGAETRAAS